MRIVGRSLAFLVSSWLFIAPAIAQVGPGGGVNQSGAVTVGDCTKWLGNGLIGDSGGGCGGTGSPGGTSGQVQFNSAGSFGGFTVSGDGALNTSTGALTVTKTNGTAFGALATVTPGTGVATLLGGASSGTGGPAGTTSPSFTTPNLGTPSAVTLTNGTGLPLSSGVTGQLPLANGGTAANLTASNGGIVYSGASALAILAGTATSGQCLLSGSNTTPSWGSCSGGAAVSSVTAGIGVTVSPTTGSVVVSAPATTRNTTTTTDTITSSDKGTIVTESNASAVAVTITTAGFVSTDYFTIKNKGAGLATYTPSSGNIGGSSTISCAQGQSADLYWDGTNLQPLANTCQLGTAALVNTGTSGGTVPLLNGNNTFSGNNTHSGSETFTEVIGGGRTVSGTTDTLAATDCGTTVVYSNTSAVTVTVPQGLPTFCVIALMQTGAGKVSTNGSAVTPATQHAAGSFTGTRAQWSVINITNYTTNTVVLSGDAS